MLRFYKLSMKNLIYLFSLLFINIGFSQVYEAGISYNLGTVVGEKQNAFPINSSDKNFGFILKKNRNPRTAYRLGFNLLESNSSNLAEVSFGIDYNFSDYNLMRNNYKLKKTAYVIFEAASIFYYAENKTQFAVVLPLGVGYKYSINKSIVASIEAKGRVAFTDKLDRVETNESTLDAYYYIGTSIYYTFGWLNSSKKKTRF